MNIEKVNIVDVKMNPKNPRTIKDDKFKKLVKSIKEFPEMLEVRPIVVDDEMVVLGGNMRLKACKEAGLKEVFIIKFSDLSEEKKKEFVVKDNVSYGDWDWEMLNMDWTFNELQDWGLDSKYKAKEDLKSKLSDRFIISPFSILDMRKGDWLNRKRTWNDLLNEDGDSRYGVLENGNCLMGLNNASLFDPVLAEIMFLWFCPKGGSIIDPFAGDIRKGAVAGQLGYNFLGIELRKEQVEINESKIKDLNLENNVKYICDSGENIDKWVDDEADMVFSCPPYFDLEVYSDLENDASNQGSYREFIEILDNSFSKAISKLKKNRFGVVVVGDIRDEGGYYRNFHEDIKNIFLKNGMPLYNEIILIESSGTAAMRANLLMKNRKVVKTHQNILVFHKPEYEFESEDDLRYEKVLVFYGGDSKEIKNDFENLGFNKKDNGWDKKNN